MHNEDEIRFKIEESSFEWETAGFKWKEWHPLREVGIVWKECTKKAGV
jgi:hypothetical protein